MTRWKRRLLIAVAVIAIIAALFVALFQGPTRAALERAEALQFRRMLVTQQGEDGDFRFFFVTNRHLEIGDGPFEERLANERGGDLSFGFFDTSIEPSLGIGMLVNPTDWFQNEEIQISQISPLDKPTAIEKLRLQVDASPYRSLLININGLTFS